VLACDVRPVEPAPGIEMVSFDRLLAESDVLSIHIHLTEENRGLVGAQSFARLKPGAVLVNTSRGAIVNEQALLEALENGRLLGAGLDVIEGEWRDDLDRHPLIRYADTHQNLVISPHVGGVTLESQRMAFSHIANKLAQYLERIS
jgi:D-3-phosphoglycerate dehydrogenase